MNQVYEFHYSPHRFKELFVSNIQECPEKELITSDPNYKYIRGTALQLILLAEKWRLSNDEFENNLGKKLRALLSLKKILFAVNCTTEKEALELFEKYKSKGWKWINAIPMNKTFWDKFKSQTFYTISPRFNCGKADHPSNLYTMISLSQFKEMLQEQDI